MRTLPALALLFALVLPASGQLPSYDAQRADAERAYAEGSYERARAAYERAAPLAPTPAERRWADFRIADAGWRAAAATSDPDTSRVDRARRQLEAIAGAPEREEDRDLVWAEAQESLGDWHWTRRERQDLAAAWPHYRAALDWWAGRSDLDAARGRYLAIVWTVAQPPGRGSWDEYGDTSNVPLELLENALAIARSPEDRARASYLLAVTLARRGDGDRAARAPELFEKALAPGRETAWYDDALWAYADFLSERGRAVVDDEGTWRREPDYPKALELYRRLTTEFAEGKTRYFDWAKRRVEEIAAPQVEVAVPSAFVPGSQIEFEAAWRNVARVDYAIYPIDLAADPRLRDSDRYTEDWVGELDLSAGRPVRAWSKETSAAAHRPGRETVRLEPPLAPGAYVVEARAGDVRGRDVLLVSDAALVLKTTPGGALAFFADVRTGEPIAGARVGFLARDFDGRTYTSTRKEAVTGADGVARVALDAPNPSSVLAGAVAGARQAFAGTRRSGRGDDGAWRIYALTDRPAYRPGETAQWKLVARVREHGAYATPAGQTVEYEITDPHHAKVAEGTARLNDFGSAWGSLELTQAMPLGPYRVRFWTAGRRAEIGSETLFRLEEYKLPEFRVSVKTPEVDGRRKAYRLGERVEVDVAAEYYFGGPVAGAAVEAVVYRNGFYRRWRPAGEFDWLVEDDGASQSYGGPGEVVKRETLRTDASGRTRVAFETPAGGEQDLEYRVEVRVVDASRREVVAGDRVRVTRQRYFADLTPEHNILHPGDAARVKLTTLDANDQPVAASGTARVTRDVWTEVWADERGRPVSAAALAHARARGGPAARGWRLVSQDYKKTEVLRRTVATGPTGDGEVAFTADREGFYTVEWTGPERGASPVKATTAVRAATDASADLGYHTGGVEIVVDRATVRAGEPVPVLLHTRASGRWVLFTVEGGDVYDHRVVRVEGVDKLISVPIDDRHVPNVTLSAVAVADRGVSADSEEVTVPPARNFLSVDVKADRALYRPRDEGTIEVTTRDADGRPVAAEVALGLTDESVYAIQKDYAGDPRRAFYGGRRPHAVQSANTAERKRYADLVAREDGGLVDRRDLATGFARLETWASIQRGPGDAITERQVQDLPLNGRNELSLIPKTLNFGSVLDVAPGLRDEDKRAGFTVDGASGAEGTFVLDGVEVTRVQDGQLGPAVVVRSDFRSTAFWQPDVVTDASGRATVKVKLPDSLTTWRAVARAATAGSQFGQGAASARTSQPLTVRLQGPRFFVAGDRVTVSAVINNNTDAPVAATARLAAAGIDVEATVARGPDGRATEIEYAMRGLPEYGSQVEVPAKGEARVDWVASVAKAGPVTLRVAATAGDAADAMERSLVAYEHGIDKLVARSGKARAGDAAFTLELPAERKPGTTSVVVQVAPSTAVTMLDALPYLIDFPYGCTEQTMSRFLPTVITERTLRGLGVAPGEVERRLFGGIEPASAAATHPRGRKALGRLDEMTRAGLSRLYDFQHPDGGWGWWKEGESDHFMTAYVVWGLALAREAGVEVREDPLDSAIEYLRDEVVEEELDVDTQAWMLHALAAHHRAEKLDEVGESERTAAENLWQKRDALNAYSRALFALAAHALGLREEAAALARNLENGATIDRAPDRTAVDARANRGDATAQPTAHWGSDGIAWRWSDSSVEATATALRALLAIDPKSPLVEQAAAWLVRNRRGAQWSNTRDTAMAVLALGEFLKVSGELAAGLEVEVLVNGTPAGTASMPANAVAAPARFAVDPSLVRDGANEVRIVRRGGSAPIYWAAEARFVSTEEPVTPAGNELFVRRDYYRLAPRETLLKGSVYDRVPLGERAELRSGDRVEVVLTVEAKNDAEYLIFEDLKPAGLEAVDLRSGGALSARRLRADAPAAAAERAERDYTGDARWVHRELRDRKVALFLDKMAQGVWEIRYELRAEVPGVFHGLPLVGQAMYAPEVRANGAETLVRVADRPGR